MEMEIDGVMITFDEKFIMCLREMIGGDRQMKRAYLTLNGKYQEKQLLDPAFVEGCWAGLKHAQADGGAIATARQKRLQQIEGAYKG